MIWGFKNTSGDEVFLLDSLLIERRSRLRGRDAGGLSVVMATTMACESTANLVGGRDFLNRF